MAGRGGIRGQPPRRWRARSGCVLSLVSSLLALAPPATAQSGTSGTPPAADDRSPIARDLFQRGKDKWTLGQYAEAVSLLAASNQQMPRAGTCMLLGDAYERLGRLRSARDTFRLASKLARDAGDSQLQYRASTREAAVLPRIPQIEVRVAAPAPPRLLVTLNGSELPPEELNVPTALDAGNYHLEARAPGYQPLEMKLTLANDGQSGPRVISLHLEPRAGVGQGDHELAWWVGGAGATLAALGLVSLAVALNEKSQSDEQCGSNANAAGGDENACLGPGVEARDRARTFAHLATAGGLLGAAGMGTGLWLYVRAGREQEPGVAGLGWSTEF